MDFFRFWKSKFDEPLQFKLNASDVDKFACERPHSSAKLNDTLRCDTIWIEIHKKNIVFDGEECDMFIVRDQSDHEKLGEARKLATTNAHVSSDMRKPIEKILDIATTMRENCLEFQRASLQHVVVNSKFLLFTTLSQMDMSDFNSNNFKVCIK